MATFAEAREFLLRSRIDYDAAANGFKWPDPAPINRALDWFDAGLATDRQTRIALRCGSLTLREGFAALSFAS